MTRLDAIKARARGALIANADLIYRHSGEFTKTQNGTPRAYLCRFSVKDPQKVEATRAAEFARSEQAAFTDVRLLRVHPDDKRPPEGSVLSTPWDGGRLEVRAWSQPSDFTGQAVALCLLRR